MCTLQDVASGVAQAVSTFVTWKKISEEKAEAKAEAISLENQAKTAEEQAGNERQEGIEAAREKRLQAILRISKEKTDSAAGNIALSSENTLNKMEDEKLNGELEALNAIEEADLRSQSYLSRAENYHMQAQLKSFQAKDKSQYLLSGLNGISSSFVSKYKKSNNKNNTNKPNNGTKI